MARLLLSVPPEVNTISIVLAPKKSATSWRAHSIFLLAPTPAEWLELGLAETLAAQSKYIFLVFFVDFGIKTVYIINV